MRWWAIAAALALSIVTVLVCLIAIDESRVGVRIQVGVVDFGEDEHPMVRAVVSEPGSARAPSSIEDREEAEDLEVRVHFENGQPVFDEEVLAYRDEALVRAGWTDERGTAHLLPFSGSGELRVLHARQDVRLPIPAGHGRFEVTVPDGVCVAGTVLIDGTPREAVWLHLDSESTGLGKDQGIEDQRTDARGSFRFRGLPKGWSGELSIPDNLAFGDGSVLLPVVAPAQDLVLALRELEPMQGVRGRVVLRGEPVSGARWRSSSETSYDPCYGTGACDERGRFFLTIFQACKGGRLELLKSGVGARELVLTEVEDLGDVELLPVRSMAFHVTTQRGEAIPGARATVRPQEAPASSGRSWYWAEHTFPGRTTEVPSLLASEPTDEDGRGVLASLPLGAGSIWVGAAGHRSVEVQMSAGPEPLEVRLEREGALEVEVCDRSGRPLRGLRIEVRSDGALFTCTNGYRPQEWEVSLGHASPESGSEGGALGFALDADGRAWIPGLRPGVPFDLLAVGDCDSIAAEARGLVLAPGEWKEQRLVVLARPRTVVVVVRTTWGNPIRGAWVNTQSSPRANLGRSLPQTDRLGSVVFRRVYGPKLLVGAKCEGFYESLRQQIDVSDGATTVEIALARDWRPWWPW